MRTLRYCCLSTDTFTILEPRTSLAKLWNVDPLFLRLQECKCFGRVMVTGCRRSRWPLPCVVGGYTIVLLSMPTYSKLSKPCNGSRVFVIVAVGWKKGELTCSKLHVRLLRARSMAYMIENGGPIDGLRKEEEERGCGGGSCGACNHLLTPLFFFFYSGKIGIPRTYVRRRGCGRLPYQQRDRHFHNFRASGSGDRQTLYCEKTSIDGFQGSELVQGLVG